MRSSAPALATSALFRPRMQSQRLQTLSMPGQPPGENIRAGDLQSRRMDRSQRQCARLSGRGGVPARKANDAGDTHQHRHQLPGQRTSAPLTTAITTVPSPNHVHTIGAGVQGPSATPSPTPRQSPDELSYSVGFSAKARGRTRVHTRIEAQTPSTMETWLKTRRTILVDLTRQNRKPRPSPRRARCPAQIRRSSSALQ